jgi:hypothetical protein
MEAAGLAVKNLALSLQTTRRCCTVLVSRDIKSDTKTRIESFLHVVSAMLIVR